MKGTIIGIFSFTFIGLAFLFTIINYPNEFNIQAEQTYENDREYMEFLTTELYQECINPSTGGSPELCRKIKRLLELKNDIFTSENHIDDIPFLTNEQIKIICGDLEWYNGGCNYNPLRYVGEEYQRWLELDRVIRLTTQEQCYIITGDWSSC